MKANPFTRFGLQPVINAAGNATRYGGSLTFPKAIQAMAEASAQYVDLDLLHRRVGKHIAALLNVEGALVTTGAAAALVHAAAACLTGSDPYLRSQLPENPPERREVIIHQCHRNPYDKSILTTGANLVEIGNAVKTLDYQLSAAINERTAAVFYVIRDAELDAALTLKETIRIAHDHGIPVILDAARKLPPKSNLWGYTQLGVDLVAFSGGKHLRGPQSSGLLVGRGDLIEAAFLNGTPNQAVGRPMKAGKEIVVGLAAAIECYLEEDEQVLQASWDRMQKAFTAALDGLAGWKVQAYDAQQPGPAAGYYPRVALYPPGGETTQVQDLAAALDQGTPRIFVTLKRDAILLNPMTLDESEAQIVIERIMTILAG
jgi:uncharacterized pyridoxal phosphate-dependent enzyme